MKNFHEYLLESETKTYDFKVKVATRVTNEMLDQIEEALKAVDLVKVGKPTHLPMQSHREFPSHGPIEATLLEVSVSFPVNDAQVRALIVERAFIPANNVVVYPKGGFEQDMRDSDEARNSVDAHKSILEQDLENITGGQEQVGDKRISTFLKDLHSRKFKFEKEEGTTAKTTNDLPQNNVSPVVGRKGTK